MKIILFIIIIILLSVILYLLIRLLDKIEYKSTDYNQHNYNDYPMFKSKQTTVIFDDNKKYKHI